MEYEYDANGRLIKTIRSNGTAQAIIYDAAGQVLQMKDTVSSGAVICQYDFAYDPYVVLLIGGLVGIIRPKLLLEFIQDENKKGKMNIDPLFSEKIYKVLEFCGGLVLIIIALGHLVFNLNI